MVRKYKTLAMPDKDTLGGVVILSNGSYPSADIEKALLSAAERVVCCDGSAMEFTARCGMPYAIVGDCDSLSPDFMARYGELIHCDSDQQSNDLTKAVRFCLSEGMAEITILGATGKREDHSLGNISLLADYARCEGVVSIKMITPYGVFEPIVGDGYFESFKGQQVSVFLPDPRTNITTVNLKYPLVDAHLTNWWQGTLNESLDDSFGILTNGTAIVFRLFQQKSNEKATKKKKIYTDIYNFNS